MILQCKKIMYDEPGRFRSGGPGRCDAVGRPKPSDCNFVVRSHHLTKNLSTMKNDGYPKEPVLVIGSEKRAFSLAVCLLQAGHPVQLCTKNISIAREKINTHLDDLYKYQPDHVPARTGIKVLSKLDAQLDEKLVIAITDEHLSAKNKIIQEVEPLTSLDTVIAINTESIPLHEIQQHANHQERIIGANWVEPVHTTFFLEIITNELTSKKLADKFFNLAKRHWQKDPYLLAHGMGIRTRMLCAMIREAFYLIEKGYVTPEDIDRACRNDPGYYFPFAGNFRYMDLMGTYIYGVVMQDLNRDLSKARNVPDFFKEIMAKGHYGMETGKGFFEYEEGEAVTAAVENWHAIFREFSYQIQKIIEKYPFQYLEEEMDVKK